MATIEIKGSVATATIITVDESEGVYRFECSKGAWCARSIDTYEGYETLADVINAAEIHVDKIEPQDA